MSLTRCGCVFRKKKDLKKVVEKVTGNKFPKNPFKNHGANNNKEKQQQQKIEAAKAAGNGDRRLSELDSHERMWGAEAEAEDGVEEAAWEDVQELGDGLVLQSYDGEMVPESTRRRAAQGVIGGMANAPGNSMGEWDYASMAGAQSVVVTYNCVAKGSSIITLTIPFVMYDSIELQWQKNCEGGPREFFTVRAIEQLVVEDGVAMDHWHPLYTSTRGQIVDSQVHATSPTTT